MKKYLFGLSAIVLAVASVAFTTPKPTATSTFIFQGDITSATDVADKTLWSEANISCPGGNEAACKIVVDELYYHFDSGLGQNVLNLTATAPEQVLSPNVLQFDDVVDTYYIGTTTGVTSIDNKSN